MVLFCITDQHHMNKFKVFAFTVKVIVLRDQGDITEVNSCVYMLGALVWLTMLDPEMHVLMISWDFMTVSRF